MLKILHTADWHIGKNLHKVPMQDQFILFFDWLLALIRTEAVDLLLVSGDIFDYANPSADDRKLYYTFLKQLVDSNTRIIITGGNHDSAGFLNAPQEVLSALDITVIGEATDDPTDEVIEIKDVAGNLLLVVAAVPFLKDKDLRNRETDRKFENKTAAVRAGINRHYQEISAFCMAEYPNVPVIAMGHLYAVGADPSDSEREIHMGNEAAVSADIFGDSFDYVALGHIHRPQIVAKNKFIRYSGSPVPLSFSEKKDDKSVVILELSEGKIEEPRLYQVPKNRTLLKITGDLVEVTSKLKQYKNDYQLRTFIELQVKEEEYSSVLVRSFEELKEQFSENNEFVIVKARLEFAQGGRDISQLFQESKGIGELSPTEVFARRLESEVIQGETAQTLKEAFLELLENVENED